MKIPVKECTLCGALVKATPESVAKHREFHRTTPRVPSRPPVLEEPSRRPEPLAGTTCNTNGACSEGHTYGPGCLLWSDPHGPRRYIDGHDIRERTARRPLSRRRSS